VQHNLRDWFVARSRRESGGRFGLWAVILLFCAAVAAVNPLRECPVIDDWAYATTVWRWLDTGEYRLHEWLAANFPFQALWGGLFCRVFGESFAALRLSTVGLSLVGLAAFRGLSLEHGLSRPAADLLTLCIASSSLFFRMSLTFMTEVPFFAMLTLAMLCYTRAVRRATWLSWVMATIAGGAVILVRQFGAALIPALAVVWLLDPAKKSRFAYYALGLSAPALAATWQLKQGWQHPNWAAQFLIYRQEFFLFSQPFFSQLPWRVTVVVEYLALWLVPLVLLAAWQAVRETSTFHLQPGSAAQAAERKWNPLPAYLACSVIFGLAVVYGWKVVGWSYNAKFRGSGLLMPFIGQSYDILGAMPEVLRWGITLFMVVGAGFFARIVAARYAGSLRARLVPADLVLDLTTLFSLGFTLGFNQFIDRYLLIYMPYVAIVVAKHLESALLTWRRAVIVCCGLSLICSAVWTREDIAKDEALWTLSKRLRVEGIPPEQIFSDWKWLFYWQFEDYVHAGHVTDASTYADLFGESWLGRNREAAKYRVVQNLTPPRGETWAIIGQTKYFSLYGCRWETYYAVRRRHLPAVANAWKTTAVASRSRPHYTQCLCTQ
jgi:hypothetical protein